MQRGVALEPAHSEAACPGRPRTVARPDPYAASVPTTNYFDTFIEVAEDCPAQKAEVPPENTKRKTVARRDMAT